MRPLSIALSGFRSFRAEQTIDFRGLGLFAIVGDTGAGKSSILEAMVYALFNATTWSERDVKTLIALDAQTMRVEFAFESGGKTYHVTRSASRIARPPIHALRCDEVPDYRFDGEAALRMELQRLLGLDWTTFTKTVVLPQGRFADLLTAREADRTRALTELLGLDEIDRIRDVLDSPRDTARSASAVLRAKREGIGPEPEAVAARLRDELAAEEARGQTLAAAHRVVDQARMARDDAEKRLQRVGVERGAHERIGDGLTRIVGLTMRDGELRVARSRAEQRLAVAEATAMKMRRERELVEARGVAIGRLAATRAALERLGPERDRLARESAELARERAGVRERELESRRSDLEIAGLQRQCDEAAATAEAAEAALETARATERARRDACEAYAAALARHAGRAEAVGSAEREYKDAATTRTTAAGNHEALAERGREAMRALEVARRDHQLGALTRGLTGGEPCPICARMLPASFHAIEVHDLERAEAAAQRAEAAVVDATKALSVAEARFVVSETVSHAAREELGKADDTLEAARQRIAELRVSADVQRAEDAIDEAQAAVAAATAAFRASRDRARTLANDVTAVITALGALREQLATDSARVAHRGERSMEATMRLEAERGGLPAVLRPSVALEDVEIAAALAAVTTAEHEARRHEAEFDAAECNRSDAQRELAAVIAAYGSEILAVVVERSAAIAAELRAVESVAYGPLPAAVVVNGELGTVFRWAARAHELGATAVANLDCERDTLQAARDAANRRAEAELATVDFAGFTALATALSTAAAHRVLLAERVRIADEAVIAARELDRQLAIAEPLAATIERLRTYLQQNAFKKYVMGRREHRLLAAATETLRSMTSGRYAFADGFQILDGSPGKPADPTRSQAARSFSRASRSHLASWSWRRAPAAAWRRCSSTRASEASTARRSTPRSPSWRGARAAASSSASSPIYAVWRARSTTCCACGGFPPGARSRGSMPASASGFLRMQAERAC